MAKSKVILSDPEDGTSKIVELEESRVATLVGRKIGDVIDGSVVDMPGYKIQITGGADKDGFPMRPSVHGGARRRIILTRGVGFKPSRRGLRKRKTVRGNLMTDEIVQINMKITEKPKNTKEGKKKEKKEEATEKKAKEKARPETKAAPE